MPSLERPDPPYLQIANYLRDQIGTGELKDGDLLPPQRQIASEWGVAAATAIKALGALRAEGFTRSIAGVGTVVQAADVHRSAHDRAISVHRTGKIYPAGHYARISSAGLAPATFRAAEALGVEEGVEVIRRRRTTYAPDDSAVSTSVSWFHGSLGNVAPLLLETERIIQGTMRYVEEQTGRVVSGTSVQHAAGFASDDDSGALDVPAESPVLLSRNRYLDTEGDVVEYGESTALPGHWVFYEYTIESDA